jgi:HK97 family phage prohead protease
VDSTRSAPFTANFVLDRKAEVTRDDDGSLTIEGYAANWLWDRSEEMFEPGAFEMGLKSFLDTNPLLAYHHQHDKALGRVVEAKIEPEGLWVKAVVDKPAPGSWAEDVVNKIESKTIKGFSVGGKFYRRGIDGPGGGPVRGARIHKVDLMEISVTPLPANPQTLFEVAGKAFADVEEPDRIRAAVTAYLDRIEGVLDAAGGAL